MNSREVYPLSSRRFSSRRQDIRSSVSGPLARAVTEAERGGVPVRDAPSRAAHQTARAPELGSIVGSELLETLAVRERWTHSFKFDFIKSASEAMRIASKVSFRGDRQGVLSLQFMVEVEGGATSFLDFRFVPYVTQEDEESESEESDF